MEALALDPGDYRGTYKLIGGRLSLEFVNTVSWPNTARRHDWLGSVGNVALWLAAVGLEAVDCKRADLVSIDTLRTTLTAVLRPLAHGKRPARDAIEPFNDCLSAANSRRVIVPSTLAWGWKPQKSALDAFGPVVLDAAELIAGGRRDRLRHCPSCDWLFEDQTRNGQRRWCDMADCGSRDKAHRYYHRSK
jgi:predicted RNA-binding Zn ribbon-like protein